MKFTRGACQYKSCSVGFKTRPFVSPTMAITCILVFFATSVLSANSEILNWQPAIDQAREDCRPGMRWAKPNRDGDCRTWYFACFDGLLTKAVCPEGSQFDPDEGECVEGFESLCLYEDLIAKCDGKMVADPTNCSKYYIDCTVKPVVRKMCPDNQYFDPKKEQCSRDAKRHCDAPRKKVLCEQGDNRKWADPKNCKRKYYECQNGTPVHHTCRPKSQFSQKDQMCVCGYQSTCSPANVPQAFNCTLNKDWMLIANNKTAENYFYLCEKGIFTRVQCIRGFLATINKYKKAVCTKKASNLNMNQIMKYYYKHGNDIQQELSSEEEIEDYNEGDDSTDMLPWIIFNPPFGPMNGGYAQTRPPGVLDTDDFYY